MRIGVDFGTTRVVVAAVDRGNYPIVAFEGPDGASWEWFPPLIGSRGAGGLFGWDAWSAQTEPGSTVVRSVKRLLQEAGPRTELTIGERTLPLLDWMTGLFTALRGALMERSSLGSSPRETISAMLGVPANANSNQRFLTAEAFRAAGFEVIGVVNEPSAASVEFGHRRRDRMDARERLLVYDLGGGTFDVSVVDIDERTHQVAATAGIATLGGDDFDEILAALALERAGLAGGSAGPLTPAERFRLAEECREKKEAINPNTRRVTIDLERVRDGLGEVSVAVSDFYERCRHLVETTVRTVDELLDREPGVVDALYVTGGGSELPLVARVLRESFGRKVKRSAYTRSATAIGLAIQGDAASGYVLRERFARTFGVWREAEAGREIVFDALFEPGTAVPGAGEAPLERSRRYAPAHNVGHFRFLECSRLDAGGRPIGDITAWDEIRFPFDPELSRVENLDGVTVAPSGRATGQVIEERYRCEPGGGVSVRIANLTAGYQREYHLARWTPRR